MKKVVKSKAVVKGNAVRGVSRQTQPRKLIMRLVVLTSDNEVIVTTESKLKSLSVDWPERDWSRYNAVICNGPFSIATRMGVDEYTRCEELDLENY